VAPTIYTHRARVPERRSRSTHSEALIRST
jgi:hypothetical protein